MCFTPANLQSIRSRALYPPLIRSHHPFLVVFLGSPYTVSINVFSTRLKMTIPINKTTSIKTKEYPSRSHED